MMYLQQFQLCFTGIAIGWGTIVHASGLEDLNNCRNSRHVDSIASCSRVIESCSSGKPLVDCPLFDPYRPSSNMGFALAGTYVDRANALSAKQDLGNASADYERALGWDSPYSGLAYVSLGRILVFMGRYSDAVAKYTAALGTRSIDRAFTPEFKTMRATAYVNLNMPDLARADLDSAITQNSSPAAYLQRAHLSAREGKFDLAHADVAVILKARPQDVSAWTMRGHVYRMQKQWGAALTDFNKSIELQPAAMSAYFGRAQLRVVMGELDSAISDLDKILGGPTKTSIIYLERGLAHMAKGNKDAAKNDLAAALTYPSQLSDRGSTHEIAKAALAKL